MAKKTLLYDPSIDYADHLALYAHKNKHKYEGCMQQIVSQFMYAISSSVNFEDKKEKYNHRCYVYYRGLLVADGIVKLQDNIIQRSLDVVPDLGQWVFLTVGFDDKTNIDGHIMLLLAQKICKVNLKKGVPLFSSGIFNLEKHRKDKSGADYIHHHAHFLLNLTEHTRASKIVELIFKASGIKEFCKQQNFIDVKTPNAKDYAKRAQPYPVCDNYIHGIKSGEKQECVGADILWRQSLGLDTIYEYAR